MVEVKEQNKVRAVKFTGEKGETQLDILVAIVEWVRSNTDVSIVGITEGIENVSGVEWMEEMVVFYE